MIHEFRDVQIYLCVQSKYYSTLWIEIIKDIRLLFYLVWFDSFKKTET